MNRIILYQFEASWIKVKIEAYFDQENLIIEGYDIGDRVEEWYGDSDYEYTLVVSGDEVVKLYPLLEVNEGDKEGLLKAIAEKYNTNTCYSEFRYFLENNQIKSEGFSWA
jgi:hypothetical protein